MIIKNKFLLYPIFLFFIAFANCSKKDATPATGVDKDYTTLGTSAKDLLASSIYTSLKVEIQYMPGYKPDAPALNNLVTFLNTYLNKPGGIQVTQKQIAASGKTSLTIEEIVNIEKTNRTAFTSGSTMVVNVIIADANYNDPNILGIAYFNTSFCIFGKIINANSGAIGQVSRTKFYTIVFEHEFGHLLGLVDLGSPMQSDHKDEAHGYHCTNTACLMYYGAENKDFTGMIIAGSIPTPDANCVADIRANGGK
ncbi:MAG: hypothetical protein H0V14_10185 [Chitinophagaceae bacterium]|nr:hypothetical protein [Chitinophagaceae bacterium]